MSCATLISRFFSTNAGAVAFTHTSYSNAYRFRSNTEREEMLRDPEVSLADDYVSRHCIRNDSLRVYHFCERMPNARACGIGLELYMFSLRYFGVVFFVCSLIAIGSLQLNYDGQFFQNDEMDWSVSFGMLGNVRGFGKGMPDLDTPGLISAQSVYKDLRDILRQHVIYDAVYTFVYILSILLFVVWTRQKIEKHRNQHPTLADFAVKLTHLPESRVMQVAELLERSGHRIVEIVPVRHLKRLIHHLKCIKHQDKLNFIKNLKERGKRYTESQLRDSEKKLKTHKEKCRVANKKVSAGHSAIFVFEHRIDKYIVQKLFHQNWLTNIMNKLRVACASEGDKHKHWLREINVKLVPTPGDIYWENIQKKRYLRRIWYYVLSGLLILAGFVIVYLLKNQQNSIKDSNLKDCMKTHPTEYCECLMGTSQNTSCANDKVQTGFVKFFISLLIIFINSCLPIALTMISTHEKQSSMPRRKLSTMIKCFFGLLINTAFVILIVNANFQEYRISKVIPMVDSQFKDFSRYWYPEVGFSIFMSMFLGIFMPHFPMSLYYSFKKNCLKCVERLYDTQITYNYWRMGADINLPLKTAYQLIIIFCCLMYSGGMPLMLPICSLTMLSMYLCERYLLRHYERPNEHSTILHTWFVKIIPLSVVFHCCFSLYSFGSESIFPYTSPQTWYNSFDFTNCNITSGILMSDGFILGNASEEHYRDLFVSKLENATLSNCKPFSGSFSNVTLTDLCFNASQLISANIRSATLVFNLTQYVVESENTYDERAENYSGVVFLVLAATALLLGLLNPFLEDRLIHKGSLSSRSAYDEIQREGFAGGKSYQMIKNDNYTDAVLRMMEFRHMTVDQEEDVDALLEVDGPLKFLEEVEVAETYNQIPAEVE